MYVDLQAIPVCYLSLLISIQYNDWSIPRRDAFAESYMNTLPRISPPSIQCCDRCSTLLDDLIQTPQQLDIRATAQDCQVCTLLLRQVCRDGRREDEAVIGIVRRGAVLQESVTGARLLRLCCDTGPS
jgi:hypothetical protein